MEECFKYYLQQKVPLKLKENFYCKAIRPAILYMIQYGTVKNPQENKLNVEKMTLLCWMNGDTRQDRLGINALE